LLNSPASQQTFTHYTQGDNGVEGEQNPQM